MSPLITLRPGTIAESENLIIVVFIVASVKVKDKSLSTSNW
jgi:hypothetical protein